MAVGIALSRQLGYEMHDSLCPPLKAQKAAQTGLRAASHEFIGSRGALEG
jgi:hypothetical protein